MKGDERADMFSVLNGDFGQNNYRKKVSSSALAVF